MTTDLFYTIACTSIIAMFFGSLLAFAGYRFLAFLLPVFGFFFGFAWGAQAMQALFGEGFLATITSWIVGFFVALLFAVLSYLFYFAAVALLAGALGYALGTGLMMAIGFDFGFLVWLVGFIVGIALAVAVLMLNIQKWVIIAATALLGAGVIVGAFLNLFGGLPPSQLVENPVRHVISNSPFWLIVYIAVAVLGFIAQYQLSKSFVPEDYNRWEETFSDTTPPSTMSPEPVAAKVATTTSAASVQSTVETTASETIPPAPTLPTENTTPQTS